MWMNLNQRCCHLILKCRKCLFPYWAQISERWEFHRQFISFFKTRSNHQFLDDDLQKRRDYFIELGTIYDVVKRLLSLKMPTKTKQDSYSTPPRTKRRSELLINVLTPERKKPRNGRKPQSSACINDEEVVTMQIGALRKDLREIDDISLENSLQFVKR